MKVFAALVAFYTTFVIAERLTLDESGKFFYIQNLLLIAVAFTSFGLQSLTLKMYSNSVGPDSSFVGYILTSLIICLVIFPLIYYVLDFQGISAQTASVLTWMISLSGLQILIMLFQARGFHLTSLWLNAVLANCILCVLLGFEIVQDLDGLISASSLSNLMIFFLSFLVALKFVSVWKVWSPLNDLYKGREFVVINLLSQVLMLGGLVTSKANLSAEDYSLLSVAFRISMAMNFLITSVNFVFTPILIRKNAADPDLAYKILVFISVFSTAFALLCFLGVTLFSLEILMIFGGDYIAAEPLLTIFMVSQISVSLLGAFGQYLAMTGYERVLRKALVTSAVTIIPMAYLMSMAYGASGAAVAICIVVSCQNIGVLIFSVVNKALFTRRSGEK